MKFRIEKDTMGEVQVPADKYWEHKQNVLETILK
jgi:fumarate hydratase class II